MKSKMKELTVTHFKYTGTNNGRYSKGRVYRIIVGILNEKPAIFIPQYQPYTSQADFNANWKEVKNVAR